MKKVLPVILSVAMLATVFTGCGSKPAATEATEPAAAATEAPAATDAAEATTTAAAEATTADISEPVTLTWYLHGSNVTDDVDVLEKANEYLKEKLNVTIKPIWGTWGDFDQNVPLSINGGDDVDIYFTCSWSADEYNAFARKGAWVMLDDPANNLIEKYAPELWKELPTVLVEGAKINGASGLGTYAVPGYKDIATQNCWDVNVTLLEKYGYTLDDIKGKSYYEFGDILKTVKEGEGKEFYPLLVEGFVLERMVNNVMIVTGDSGTGNMLSYYMDPTDVTKPGVYENKIMNKFATPEFKKFAEQTREYFLAGYIDPAMGNANQANDTRAAKQLSAEYLIGTQSYALGCEVQYSRDRKIEVAMVPCTDPYVDTTSSQGAMMAISTASKNPERAMMFLNLLNTDPYLMTLLNFGIEGVHYDMVDGEAVFIAEKRDTYIPWTNGMGNATLLPAQQGQGVDFQDQFKAYYGAAQSVPVLGFAFDPTSVETEVGALANVVAEYGLALNTGTIDPAEKLPEFLKKLEENGINKVVDEANTQLDAFIAAKTK